MEESSHLHELRQLILNFQDWVQSHQVSGTDGLGGKPHFVPFADLRSYWQDEDGANHAVSRVLTLCGCIDLDLDNVVSSYLRIFSILVYISGRDGANISLIESFCNRDTDDSVLPFQQKPPAFFSDAPNGITLWDDFDRHQYLFSPITFADSSGYGGRLSKRKLPRRTILPIEQEDIISGREDGTAAVIKRCKLHKSSNLKGLPDVPKHPSTVALQQDPGTNG